MVADLPQLAPIQECLAIVRRRLWTVRLLERLTLALQWGALIALPLTASRLFHEPLPWEDRPWTALLLAFLPLGAAYWLWQRPGRFSRQGLSPRLVRIAAITTAGLSATATLWLLIALLHPASHNWYTLAAIAAAPVPIWSVPLAVILCFILLAATTLRLIDYRSAAIYVDQQVGLQERVSTAWELLQTAPASSAEEAFRAPVVSSALDACQKVRTAKVNYQRLDSRLYATAALVAIAAAALTLLPPMPARAVTLRKPSTIVIQQSKEMHDVLDQIQQQKLPNDTITPDKIKPLENAITQLQNGTMSPIETSAVLNQARDQLKQEQEAMTASDKVEAMLNQADQTKDLARAADAMKQAQMDQAQGNATANQEQKDAGQALQSAASDLANKMKSGQMSAGQQKALGDQLQAAADQAKSDPQLQKDLQNAADAAHNGDADKLAQSMQSAGQRMGQQSASNQLSQGAMNRAMSEIDRMQNGGGQGSQSTMGNGGSPGDQGQNGQNSGNNQANNQGGNQGGNQGNPSGNQGGSQDSGQDQASASGGQQPGAGNQPGAGAQGGQANADRGGSSGLSTDMHAPSGPGDDVNQHARGGLRSWVQVYDPTSIATNGSQQKVGSYIDPLHPASASMDVLGPASDKNSQIKTYQDVLPDARQQAMDEMARQEYPPQYQDMVRQFYEDTPQK